MIENELSYKIRGAIFEVYNTLGPGLLESVYEIVLVHVLTSEGLAVEFQVTLPIIYKDIKIDNGYKIDLLVNNLVIVEIKSVKELKAVHHKQLITYLKLSGKKLGLLVNFNSTEMSQSIFRKVNGL